MDSFYNKGGEYRKWYGNQDYVVNWENNGFEIKENTRRVYPQLGDDLGWKISNEPYYFREQICWTDLTSKGLSFRVFPTGFIFDASANVVFTDESNSYSILAFLNSVIVNKLAELINPTLHFKLCNFNSLPALQVTSTTQADLSKNSVALSKKDWDSFETSWDFETHPMVRWSKDLWDTTAIGAAMRCYYGDHPKASCPLELCWMLWKGQANQQFRELKANEEELNRIFIDIYGLQDELTPQVADKDVTVHYLVDTKDDIPVSLQGSNYVLTRRDAVVSLISYAVGCMFGRYSIYADGLLYAGGLGGHYSLLVEKIQDLLKAQGKSMFPENEFYPDEDNVIPICDDEYFDDDIVGRFVKFIEAVYGSDTLEENLKFVADALGGKGTARDVIRSYFLNDFYADHCKTYQKRPIYWLFDSGKKNGFKALIYMHRYQPDTIARIRTDYVHEQQSRYRTAIADLESRIASTSTAERVKLNKQLKKLQDQDAELRTYEEKIHHLADQMISIDLDDGIKVNYAKFQDVLGKIK